MINNRTTIDPVKLQSVTGVVYQPMGDWNFSHHASIAFFKGKFWAVWSNGMKNEDDLGQRVLIAESPDGEHWEKVRPAVTPEILKDKEKILTAAGFYVDGDILNMYFGYYIIDGYDPDNYKRIPHKETGLGMISTTDGENWSEPRLLGVPIVPNHGPEKTASGRLIISGNMMFPYTDNPNGVDGYRITGIYGEAFGENPPYDDEFGHKYVTKFHGWLPERKSICEGSFFQTDDGVLHMMLRSNADVLWHSESKDDGATWTEPKPTEYSDGGSKFHCGRLPDGRFYCVSNPVPGSGRLPLSICLSEDGENFDQQYIIRDEPYKHRSSGLHKNGNYGYPHTLIHDGYMYVIYSKGKEMVEVTKFALDQL